MKHAPHRFTAPLLFAFLLAGCGEPIGVRPTDDQAWFRAASTNALTSSSPSVYATQFLAERGLVDKHRKSPREVLTAIREELCADSSREAAGVLAELSYLEAKRPWLDPKEALRLHADVVVYAYSYLFDGKLGAAPSPFDARFRLACDLYNRSLARLIREARERNAHWGDALQFQTSVGHLDIQYGHNEMAWGPGAYHDVRTVYEFEVRGIENHYRTSGLGVPVLMLRKPPPPEEQTPQERFLPRQVDEVDPATILLTLHESVCDSRGPESAITATIDIFDPIETVETRIGDSCVQLETDLTTPLAYMLEHAPRTSGMTGLLDVPAWENRRGLYMLHPYRPGKIPVVFVHGLLSSPITWLEMINDLGGDPEIREHYQIWYFMYPTGNPILYSSAQLRRSLLDARAVFDPEGNDPAFNQMMLVGHSMGGLLSRLCIQESGGKLWHLVTDKSLNDLHIPEAERGLLRDVFFFDPVPSVRRVIFIATPHRGSGLADLSLTQSFSSMIKLPAQVNNVLADLQENLPDAKRSFEKRHVTSLAGLSPENPMLMALDSLQINPNVTYHSIIANHVAADTPGGTDTIVPYNSATLAGAASEKIIKGTHTCTDEPAVIREVRRILLEHADAEEPRHGAAAH